MRNLSATRTDNGGVAELVIHGEATTPSTCGDLYAHLVDLGGDSDIKCVVLRATPGDDSWWLMQDVAGHEVQRCLTQINAIPQPCVAVVEGRCGGFGLQLVLHCDVVIASRTAEFGGAVETSANPELAAALAQRIGRVQASGILLAGTTVGAELAQRGGLVDICCAPEDLDANIDRFVATYCKTWESSRPLDQPSATRSQPAGPGAGSIEVVAAQQRDWVGRGAYDGLLVTQCGAAAHVLLSRSERLNAFDVTLVSSLLSAVTDLAHDDSIRAIIIAGEGRAFSAGADTSADFGGGSEDRAAFIDQMMTDYTTPLIAAIRQAPKPVIAAVNGAAVGYGCSLACSCDYLVAAESAYFSLAFANVGLTIDGGASLTVPARIGWTRAMSMALVGDPLGSATALEWGLANRVVADEELDGVARDLALKLSVGPTQAYAALKRVFNDGVLGALGGQLDLETSLQTRLIADPDFVEGLAAFRERRAPSFTGLSNSESHAL